MLVFAVIAAWFALGVVAVVVMRRRGHDTFAWAFLFLILGPLALALVVSAERHPVAEPEYPFHGGHFDVLVAHDGSVDASAALDSAVVMLGEHMTSLTLSKVVDAEAPVTTRGRETLREAHEHLEAVAHRVSSAIDVPVETVVLCGDPARTLQGFASGHGYELIVAGTGDQRATRLTRRSVTRRLAVGTPVAVWIGPSVR